ncbi:MAG: triose-phosphate isomerase [Acidobacteriota bacterium]|nr:triose-phosphate isomerase [Acidobacteriota bacterium]
MVRPVVAGNWKMYKTISEARNLAAEVVKQAPAPSLATIILIPPFTAIQEVKKTVSKSGILVGGQDLFWEEEGAFTGEISAIQLREAGCDFVLVGHSERRQFFGETDEMVRKKVQAARQHELRPIVCIGENLEDRKNGQTLNKIKSQLENGLFNLPEEEFRMVILAYEPIWAIGTGQNATPEQAEEVHNYIRQLIASRYGKNVSACAIILYGGSVKPANAFSLIKEKDVDGFLVGGASLKAESFLEIVREASRSKEG